MKLPGRSTRGHRGRIFLSYRRRDSTWFVGRLSDSLSQYFGDERVFRDVGDIEGGADFHERISDTLESADALIAVIGPNWLTATDRDGNRILGTADDWVCQEIGAALERGIPVYPVLVEDTPMPRASELPPALERLTRFNAVSLGDDRWDADVARLASIVGLDIPSANERKLMFWNQLTTLALVLSVWATMLLVANRYFGSHSWFYFGEGSGQCDGAPFNIIDTWESGLIYFALVPCLFAYFGMASQVVRKKRRYLRAAVWVGAAGASAAMMFYLPVCAAFEAEALFFFGVPLVVTVLGLVNLSGLTPK